MEFKQVVQKFKAEHLKAGEVFPFSLLPLLMADLIKHGLTIEQTNGKFYQELADEIFDTDTQEIKSYGIDVLFILNQSVPAPIPVEIKQEVKQVRAVEALVDDGIIRTDHLTDNIPNEDDEGDPFYIPPEERIELRPEDCAPMEYDEEFCKLIGVKPDRYKR